MGDPSTNYAYHALKTMQEVPDKNILVVEGDKFITGREFHQQVSNIVFLMKQSGFQPKDRVIITGSLNTMSYCIIVAVLAAGGAIVIIDPAMGIERLNHCIGKANPTAWMWPEGSYMKWLKYIVPALRRIPIHLEVRPIPNQPLMKPEDVSPVEHAIVTFTTGSTGMPKLLLRKHDFILNQSKALSVMYDNIVKKELHMEERDAVFAYNLAMFPLHYCKVGSTCIVFPKFTKDDPAQIFRTIKKHQVTAVLGSPAFVHKVAQYATDNSIMMPVLYSGVGGAPVYKKMFRTITSTTKDKKTALLYGSTEAEPISLVFAEEKLQVETEDSIGICVGKPVFENSVKVITLLDEGVAGTVDVANDLELPRREIGELIITGWHVNTYQVEEKRLIKDKDGTVWLRIEDAGYLDEEGRIWLVGRAKWRVLHPRTGKTHWSFVVEQQVLNRTSLITFVSYLNHQNKAYLFVEAPSGLPEAERIGLQSFLDHEEIPVDTLVIKPYIKKDRRHASKPDTAYLFSSTKLFGLSVYISTLSFVVGHNPLIAVLFIFLLLLIVLLLNVVLF